MYLYSRVNGKFKNFDEVGQVNEVGSRLCAQSTRGNLLISILSKIRSSGK